MTIKELGTNLDENYRNDLNNNFRELSGFTEAATSALNKANAADQKATSALQQVTSAGQNADSAKQLAQEAKTTANNANNTSNSVQEQLNQIVIEGDSSVEAAQARVDDKGIAHPTLKDRIDSDSTKIEVVSNNFKSIATNEAASLGTELLTATGWQSVGWSGDFNNGFTNTIGNTQPLKYPIVGVASGKYYHISLTTETTDWIDPPGWFTISIGGSEPFETYRGGGNVMNYSWGIKALGAGDLIITPFANFKGVIKTITVKEITGYAKSTMTIKDNLGGNSVEIRPTNENIKSIFIGKDSGAWNTTGDDNVSVGNESLKSNTTGYWNSALGSQTLKENTVGSRNIAIGRVALRDNLSGHRNIAVGTFALNTNTHGHNNVAIGADAMIYSTTGICNIAIGTIAMEDNKTGSYNVAIGYEVMKRINSGQFNVAFGRYSQDRNKDGNDNITIGGYSGERLTASANIAIGKYALNWVSTTDGSVAIGHESQRWTKAGDNVSVGYQSLTNLTDGIDNVALGKKAGANNTTGQRNISIGNNAGLGASGSAVNRNIFIGHNVGVNVNTGADNNIIIGTSAGATLTTGANNILLGYGIVTPTATTSNYMSLGDTIYGDITNKLIGIGLNTPTARLHIRASNGSANTAPIKLTSGSLLATPENLTIETDGTDLYWTSGGIRKKIQLV